MKFINPFKKKIKPEIEKAYQARAESTKNKMDAADKIIKMMETLYIERRRSVETYSGPERRMA